MKVAVLNFTGTVGKTTVAAHLLFPRMPEAQIFAVESINETADGIGLDVEKMRGDMFRELLQRIMLEDSTIIDVGASNVESFMVHLEEFEGAHEEIDFYIVPVTGGTKEQIESVRMIESLAAIGIAPSKIKVLFNRVHRDVEIEFPIIQNFFVKTKMFSLNNKCAIYETELFDALSMRGISLQGLMADDNDYKTLLKDKSANADDRERWSDMYGLKLLCKGVNRKLDVVYEELFS